jgi:hypothetical protein
VNTSTRLFAIFGGACGVILFLLLVSINTGHSPNKIEPSRTNTWIVTQLPSPHAIHQIITLPPEAATQTPEIIPTSTIKPTHTASATPTIGQGEKEVIGYSVKGFPLEVYHFGDGKIERMIIAGIHGGYESNTVDLADLLIDYLQKNPGIVPADKTLYLLRVLNPDGLLEGQNPEGRANDADWTADWDPAGCWSMIHLSGGAFPHSEPETQALSGFILTHHLDAVISYHSAGLGIFSGGQPSSTKSILLAQLLSKVSGYSYPPIQGTCRYTGQLIDWVANHGIAAVDVELSNHTDTDFDVNLKILSAFLKWDPK